MSGYTELRDLGVTFRPPDGALPADQGRSSPFTASWGETVEILARELRQLGAQHVIVELALRERDLRVDGLPRADARLEQDAVRISFESMHGQLRYETGEFTRAYWRGRTMDGWQSNLRAIALGLEALRKVDRYGIAKRGEQYRGYRQIAMHTSDPADLISTPELAREFLSRWGGDIKAAIKATHPDAGGDATEFRKVMRAKELVA